MFAAPFENVTNKTNVIGSSLAAVLGTTQNDIRGVVVSFDPVPQSRSC